MREPDSRRRSARRVGIRAIGLASFAVVLQFVSSEGASLDVVAPSAASLALVVMSTDNQESKVETSADSLTTTSAPTDSSVVGVVATTTTISSSDSFDLGNTESHAAERAMYVKSILIDRMRYIKQGKRSLDFAKWVQQRHGAAAVFPLNQPVEKDEEKVDFHTLAETDLVSYQRQLKRKDPFPPNRIKLDLFLTEKSPPNCYRGRLKHAATLEPPNLFQLGCRAIKLGINFAPVLSTLGLAVVSKSFREGTWFPWLASCIGSSGAAWIKWGQWSSTRNDMFPEALCDQLARLQSDAPAHSAGFSHELVEESLGLAQGTLESVFDDFDDTPLASGSIAQVHRAVLDGQLVAVKIRHPNVAQLIDMDFRLMTVAARIFDFIPALSWLHIRESVEQFSHTMAAQSYLNVEAHHLEVLNHNFRKWPQVRFPQPFYASPTCIIESFEPGKIVTSIIEKYNNLAEEYNIDLIQGSVHESQSGDAAIGVDDGSAQEGDDDVDNSTEDQVVSSDFLQGHDLIPLSLARFIVGTGLGLYLKMLLIDGLMHADLHAGNIILDVQRKPSLGPPVRSHVPVKGVKVPVNQKNCVTLVDAGMVAQLTDEEGATFIGLLASLGEGDGRQAAKFALQFSLENNMSAEEQEEFTLDMEELFAERCRGYGTNVNVGYALRGILGLIRKHRVRIDANFATLAVNCLCLESLASQVLPSYNLLDMARPLLQSYRRMCYTTDGTPKPQARKSKWVKFRLSLMYLRKMAIESSFFRQRSREKKKAAAFVVRP